MTEQIKRPQVERRRLLAGLVGAAAASAGFAALPTSAATVGLARGRVNVQDFGAIGDGVADDTAAVMSAFDAALGRAPQGPSPHKGRPTVYFPAGRYRVMRTLHRAHGSGLIMQGDGMRASVLQLHVREPLLEVRGSSSLLVRDLTLSCGSPEAPWRTGLVENTTAVLFRQRTDDAVGGLATDVAFERCEFVGFHRALWFVGNAGGDTVTWRECRWVDNFLDFDFVNGRSARSRVVGGAVSSFRGAPEGHYNERLASWSPASRPPSAPLAQPRDPADPASPRQQLTVRDGAVCRAVAGGGVHFRGTSVAGPKTTLLLGELTSSAGLAAANYGTAVNDLQWTFENCSWRGLGADRARDLFGYERTTLLRYERPHPHRDETTLRVTVRVAAARITEAAPATLLHLTNGVHVFLLGAGPASAAQALRVVGCVTGAGSTASNPGRLVTRGLAPLQLEVDARLPGGRRRWDNPLGVGHRVTRQS